MILIVSGGIGSGKSVAAGMLNEMFGFPVYCSDKRVKELYYEHPTLLKDIERELGCLLRDGAGNFDPSALARKIFLEGDALEKVESLVFPVLVDDLKKWMNSHPSKVHLIESATILEKDYFRGFGDLALVMTAPSDVRISRAMERDSSSEEQVKSRMQKQGLMNSLELLEQFCWLPYEICENDGNLDELRLKLNEFAEKYGLTKML